MYRLQSPGGGGYGDPAASELDDRPPPGEKRFIPTGSVAAFKVAQESA